MKNNKGLLVLNWIFSVFNMGAMIIFGINIGSILMLVLGIVSMPIKAFIKVWEKLPAYRVLRPLIIGILFVVSIIMLPKSRTY